MRPPLHRDAETALMMLTAAYEGTVRDGIRVWSDRDPYPSRPSTIAILCALSNVLNTDRPAGGTAQVVVEAAPTATAQAVNSATLVASVAAALANHDHAGLAAVLGNITPDLAVDAIADALGIAVAFLRCHHADAASPEGTDR